MPARRPLEPDQPGLLRVEGQAVLPESLRQHVQDPARVFLAREDHDDVVRVADRDAPALQAWLHVLSNHASSTSCR